MGKFSLNIYKSNITFLIRIYFFQYNIKTSNYGIHWKSSSYRHDLYEPPFFKMIYFVYKCKIKKIYYPSLIVIFRQVRNFCYVVGYQDFDLSMDVPKRLKDEQHRFLAIIENFYLNTKFPHILNVYFRNKAKKKLYEQIVQDIEIV